MYSNEISQSKVLQWSLGALIFVYFVVFLYWISVSTVTKEALSTLNYVCPPYFQSCEFFYVLEALPIGYSQSILYMIFFGILSWCVYLMSEKAWSAVQLALFPIFIWHTSKALLFTDHLSGNYEYYIIAFAFVLLFLPYKEFFLKLVLVYFYVLSTAAKIHPSWIEGGYFNALKTGLPLFPDWSIPIWTNFVIMMEMIGAWFLMSRNFLIQRIALVCFVFFHLYSGILVEYRYPATVLPFLLILFGPWYRYTPVPLNLKAIGGWSFILLLTFLQLSPKMIPGDEKLTMEGNKYGLYMFEANHQCISESVIHLKNGESEEINKYSTNARSRCAPYTYWFKMKKTCETITEVSSIEWKFYHSINGGPFYKLVDTKDACQLEFKPFSHNKWIGTEENSEIFGYPVKNGFN